MGKSDLTISKPCGWPYEITALTQETGMAVVVIFSFLAFQTTFQDNCHRNHQQTADGCNWVRSMLPLLDFFQRAKLKNVKGCTVPAPL